jgi:hypothetical protein
MSAYVASSLWSSSSPVALLLYPTSFHGNLAFDGPTNAALASLPALCFATHAGVIASTMPLLLPALQWHHPPCCTGVITLVTPASLPASRTGVCPVMTQSRHVAGEALLLRSSLLPMALSLYTALVHSDLAFNGLAEAAMAFSLASRWHPCPYHAGVITSIELSSSPALRRRRCRVCLQRSGRCRLAFAGIALASLPALHWRHHQHCAVIIIAGVAPALLPLLPSSCAPRGGIHPSAIIAVHGVLAVSGVIDARPLFSVA